MQHNFKINKLYYDFISGDKPNSFQNEGCETMNGTKDGWTTSSKKHSLILLSSVGKFVSMIDR